MQTSRQKLLIISRDALLDAVAGTEAEPLYRTLATLNRKGLRLLLTAPEPDRWLPTRKNVDNALSTQRDLLENIRGAGGDLEGIYYVPRSLLTQDRNRDGALRDILKRYSVLSHEVTLISTSNPFVRAAERVGIQTMLCVASSKQGLKLAGALERLMRPGGLDVEV